MSSRKNAKMMEKINTIIQKAPSTRNKERALYRPEEAFYQ